MLRIAVLDEGRRHGSRTPRNPPRT